MTQSHRQAPEHGPACGDKSAKGPTIVSTKGDQREEVTGERRC